jgi:hypothetical protein
MEGYESGSHDSIGNWNNKINFKFNHFFSSAGQIKEWSLLYFDGVQVLKLISASKSLLIKALILFSNSKVHLLNNSTALRFSST